MVSILCARIRRLAAGQVGVLVTPVTTDNNKSLSAD